MTKNDLRSLDRLSQALKHFKREIEREAFGSPRQFFFKREACDRKNVDLFSGELYF